VALHTSDSLLSVRAGFKHKQSRHVLETACCQGQNFNHQFSILQKSTHSILFYYLGIFSFIFLNFNFPEELV
jgi:hypothetical protein